MRIRTGGHGSTKAGVGPHVSDIRDQPVTVREAELPDALRIHDLRHTAASFMIFEGAHLELVRKQLGHSSVIVTQRYAHLYPSQGEDLAVRLDLRRQSTIDRAVGL